MAEWSVERVVGAIVALLVSYFLLSSMFSKSAHTRETLLADVPMNPILAEHGKKLFEEKVVEVSVACFTKLRT